ncbi:MAG TPA: histidine kinase [Puia sp.]|jgi:sensor histidine kinase YesM|nr:histidine kinase [Puia sp.]
MKRRRFSLKKVFGWVTLVNIVAQGLVLVIFFFVRIPNQDQHVHLRGFYNLSYYIRVVYSILFQTVFYYFALNGYYKLMRERKRTRTYFWWSLLLLVGSFIHYQLYDMLVQKSGIYAPFDISMKIFSYTFVCLFQLAIALIIVSIIWQLDEKNQQYQRSRLLEQQKTQLEKEKIQANYLFLKAQINPHFLHNTLNFLYAKSLPYSTELSEGILTLSEIMRYSLNKEEDETGKVLLTQEIEHVNNIIKIQQLRFAGALQVVFDIRGEAEGLRILPFIFITIVENAFKHGELKNAEVPVRLELTIHGRERLHFHCANRKKTGPRELSTGIGLDNTRKRLELAYGQDYSLYIKDQKDLYIVDLDITLSI